MPAVPLTWRGALRAALKADAAVAAACGAAPGSKGEGRAEWGLRPQGQKLPALALIVVFDDPVRTAQGRSGFVAADLQVEAWAGSPAEAVALAEAATACLERLSGAPWSRPAEVSEGGDTSESGPAPARQGGGSADFHRIRLAVRVWRLDP
jgi:hypothetical protein